MEEPEGNFKVEKCRHLIKNCLDGLSSRMALTEESMATHPDRTNETE